MYSMLSVAFHFSGKSHEDFHIKSIENSFLQSGVYHRNI